MATHIESFHSTAIMTDVAISAPTGFTGFDQVNPSVDEVNDWLLSELNTPVTTYIVPFHVIVLPDGLISTPEN
jgi:hypothetical protein